MNKTLSVIIPTYNEQDNLLSLVEKLMPEATRYGWEVIFVNDASIDKSYEILKSLSNKYNLKIIINKVNKGYGGAIKKGIRSANSDLVITFDADGQHDVKDIKRLYDYLIETDADMVVGKRDLKTSSFYRRSGKFIIRTAARILLPLKVSDINSGLKIYYRNLVLNCLDLCPDTMAYSDVITLLFVMQKKLVLEKSITVHKRTAGDSTISLKTAFETFIEILNIVMLFNPLKFFLPISLLMTLFGLLWGLQFIIQNRGLSVGSLFCLSSGILFFLLGMLAEQISYIRRKSLY